MERNRLMQPMHPLPGLRLKVLQQALHRRYFGLPTPRRKDMTYVIISALACSHFTLNLYSCLLRGSREVASRANFRIVTCPALSTRVLCLMTGVER